jgi:hypothetical protein
VRLLTFTALAALSGSALAGDYTCTTDGLSQVHCVEDKPLVVYPFVNKNAAMRKGIEDASRKPDNVRLIKDATGRVCAYEIRGSVPVKLGCE